MGNLLKFPQEASLSLAHPTHPWWTIWIEFPRTSLARALDLQDQTARIVTVSTRESDSDEISYGVHLTSLSADVKKNHSVLRLFPIEGLGKFVARYLVHSGKSRGAELENLKGGNR